MTTTSYILPDFVSQCPYQLRVSPLNEVVAHNTEKWVLNMVDFDEKTLESFLETRGGSLAGYSYPDADEFHLQVASNFMEWLFCFDDYSDKCTKDEARILGDSVIQCFRDPRAFQSDVPVCKLAKDFACRLLQSAGPRCMRRFADTIESYMISVTEQARDRDEDITPDMESYISLRRETGALPSSFVLIEFAAGLDLPDEVIEHPLIRSMEMATNDWTAWTNDVLSYHKECAIGDTHNIVAVIMNERKVDLQTAMDQAGDLCHDCIKKFEEDRQALPSWGPDIDRQVQLYVQGLQDWIVGALHWSFVSKRYFGVNGEEMKKNRAVNLLPKIEEQIQAADK
ncbi:hypothetical protein QCA50_005989 [Cerrena zonata]|uniref:Terpene synthase n=1 Tax=Cerrena zonata TaxID=2478898 RepID=A0AAW0GGP0_9APHY